MQTENNDFAVILAAGRGTRMKSTLAKVLHPLLGRPMVGHVVDAAKAAGLRPILVVHHQEDAVREALAGDDVVFARQQETRGTGDAVASALSALPSEGTVVVLSGDAPLVTSETVGDLRQSHGDAAVTVLTCALPDGAHYGRLERRADGSPWRIVESKECTPEQLAITEVNTGVYCFDIAWLRTVLPTLQPHAHKAEIYLTDVVELASDEGRCKAVIHPSFDEVQGVNDRWELACARRQLQARIVERHGRAGVDFVAPETVVVDTTVELAADVTVGPGVVLRGATRIGSGATVGAHCEIADSTIGPEARIESFSSLDSALVESKAVIGPYARLRPGSSVGESAKVGNFVEMKKSRLGAGAKANHLSYIGDATVGAGANIGAGTITCNYDGFSKSETVIGEAAFIGSNAALVAPVTIGADSIVGAGSVVTKDVPDGAVAIARGQQQNLEGAAERFRSRKARDST
ncbi:MAG: bifunctional UDP-N-acetylglucosamine diphosphorylase/glucosamine-1-phosphate N-acetyltransferase GlmU [Myxococcota bacterium]|nr:bifunctional UDP-N-acetylglucosamine diphosphorylase/glucosamine-1-phosphate N-acetyltransferase GlmU [Myxococcota bacterium]